MLMSPGSCLERFQAHPYIECGSHGTCHYYEDKYSFWLVTASRGDWIGRDQSETLKGDSWENKISRCSVCQQESAYLN